jgi:hypothetical protein
VRYFFPAALCRLVPTPFFLSSSTVPIIIPVSAPRTASECAMVVTAGTKAYKPVARFANPALIVAFLWSAGLNAFAFSAASSVLWMTVVAATLGASIRR